MRVVDALGNAARLLDLVLVRVLNAVTDVPVQVFLLLNGIVFPCAEPDRNFTI